VASVPRRWIRGLSSRACFDDLWVAKNCLADQEAFGYGGSNWRLYWAYVQRDWNAVVVEVPVRMMPLTVLAGRWFGVWCGCGTGAFEISFHFNRQAYEFLGGVTSKDDGVGLPVSGES